MSRMNKLILAILLISCAGGIEALLPTLLAQTPAAIPVSPEDQQAILAAKPDAQTMSLQNQIIAGQVQRIEQLTKELARIRACLAASIPAKECGQLSPDGSTVMRFAPVPVNPPGTNRK